MAGYILLLALYWSGPVRIMVRQIAQKAGSDQVDPVAADENVNVKPVRPNPTNRENQPRQSIALVDKLFCLIVNCVFLKG